MNNAFSIALRSPVWAHSLGHFSAYRFFVAPIRTASRLHITPAYRIPSRAPQRRTFTQSERLLARSRATKPLPPQPTKPWKDLKEAELRQIFGGDADFKKGNFILARLQQRRISGSLVEKGLIFPDKLNISQAEATRALEWLRTTFPMDEEAAAAQWAEKELLRLEEEQRSALERRGQQLGLLKKEDPAHDRRRAPPEDPVDAGSVLVQRRKEVQRQKEVEAKRQQEAEAESIKTGVPANVILGKHPQEYALWRQQQWDKVALEKEERYRRTDQKAREAELSTEQILAKRSAFSRLFPSTLFTAVFIYGCYVYASNYEPPPSSARMLSHLPPAVATFMLLFNINALIFTLWRAPSAWKILNRYFMVSAGHPRVLSLLGATFSHQFMRHFLPNMAVLYFVGNPVHDLVGRGNFLAVYLGTGVLASLGGLWRHVLTKNYLAVTVGASGGLFGLIGCYFALKDRDYLSIPGFPDLKFEYETKYVMGIILFAETLAMFFFKRSMTDHGMHVAGLLAGYLAGTMFRTQAAKQNNGGDEDRKVTKEEVQ